MTAARRLAARPLVIVGPTASGKSDLALAVARAVGRAEIVTLDSMQVYRGMDIGTATPAAHEQAEVPHHLIDVVDPCEEFTVAEQQRRVRAALGEIRARQAVPVLVGGTGLYVRAVVDGLRIPGRYPQVRADLEAEPDTGVLHRRLAELDPVAAGRMEPTNRRRVLRALEVTLGSGQPFSTFGPGLDHYPPTPFVQVGLRWDRAGLDERIVARYRRQMAAGLLDEVRSLARRPLSRSAAQALGYKELLAHLRGEFDLQEALDLSVTRTRRFARRQERWFRRDMRIRWLDAPATAADALSAWEAAAAPSPSTATSPPRSDHSERAGRLRFSDTAERAGMSASAGLSGDLDTSGYDDVPAPSRGRCGGRHPGGSDIYGCGDASVAERMPS